MMTLALAIALQAAPSISDVPQAKRARADTFKRSLAMTGTSFGSVFTTATVGGIAGLLLGAAFVRSFDVPTAGLFGSSLGAMIGVAVSPFLAWAVGRALGGEGTLLATILGTVGGAALWVLSLGIAVVSVPGWSPANLIPLVVTLPALFIGGPWAFEISDSATLYVAPTSLSMTL